MIPLNFIPKLISPSLKPNINLIFIHDLLGSALNFSPISSFLKYNSFYLDMRNHGFSEHSPIINYPVMSKDLHNFIKTKNMDNLVLIGHGMGGKVLMSFLNNYPEFEDIVKGVIILDIAPIDYLNERSFAWPTELWILLADLQFLKLNQTNYNTLKEKVSKMVYNQSYVDVIMSNLYQDDDPSNYKYKFNLKSIITNFQELITYKPPNKGNYKGKKLIVLGEKSDFVPEKYFDSYKEIFQEFVKEKDIKFVKNASHFIHKEEPKEFMRIINEFIDGI